MVRNCKQRLRREMLTPVGSNWTLNIYNTLGDGCGSCGSCEVWCCMKHELRIDERNSLSWPQRLCPQMHKAGNGACGGALGRRWRRNKELRPPFTPSLMGSSSHCEWFISYSTLAFSPTLCQGWHGLALLQLLSALTDPCWASHECLRHSSFLM